MTARGRRAADAHPRARVGPGRGERAGRAARLRARRRRRLAAAATAALAACAGGGGAAEPGGADGGPAGRTVSLPFAHRVDDRGHLLVEAGPHSYVAEIGPWGTVVPPFTGHAEGDWKSNGFVHIVPDGAAVELVGVGGGNGDGVCDPGEVCGVDAPTALANGVWYTVEDEGVTLRRVELDLRPRDGFVPGETGLYSVAVEVGGLVLHFGHGAELSPYIEQLLEEHVPDQWADLREHGGAVDLVDPIDLARGERVVRAQVSYMSEVEQSGRTLYHAVSVIEWMLFPDDLDFDYQSPNPWPCMFQFVSAADRDALQTALTRSILDPIPSGRFSPVTYPQVTPFLATAAQLCATDAYVPGGRFDRLRLAGSNTWIDNPTTPFRADVFSVYDIRRGEVFDALASDIDPSAELMLFRELALRAERGAGVALSEGGVVTGVRSVGGEVLGLDVASDTPASSSFVVRIRWAYGDGADALLGRYWPVRYRLLADRVAVHWGAAAPDRASAVVPPEIGDDPRCDGAPVVCYDHDVTYGLYGR
ncbi:MAG: hypothetical protein D6689_22270 [Deltaproteobacteria bacterium]|nr:MAG: hypothetical protein D6689_22270 [Deltaproteobacteria bacterium]